jgi:lambda family phage portal protein
MASSQFRVSWWDRLLIGIAPKWGLHRVRSRAAATTLARHYEAASTGRRTSGWHRSNTDANAAAGPALSSLRELSRDLRRNNGWARRGVQVIANNTIGWGIAPKAIGVDPALAEAALQLWNSWADSSACDFAGQMTFYGLQRLVMKTVVESGEALVVRQPAAVEDGLAIPLRLQVLEPDYLDSTKDGIVGASGPIVQGVEFDGHGHPVAYHLFTVHPGGTGPTSRVESRRVAATDVLHIYQVERAGQVRGVPWLTSAIVRLNDFDDYDDASLMQQKVAACFGAFVQDLDSAGVALGEQSKADAALETLEPGHIEYLPPGKTVTFATPPPVADASFTTRSLRLIAVSIGVTYEDLTGDYSMVNFSSARMARLSHWANVNEWRWDMVIPQLCAGVWRWTMELAAALHGWPAVPRAEWAPPPMPMLEPDKEGLAYQRLVRTGAMTLSQMIRERGEDPATHLAEIAADNARLDELGIVLDCDPRRTSAAGMTQAAVGGRAAGGGDHAEEPEPATDGEVA